MKEQKRAHPACRSGPTGTLALASLKSRSVWAQEVPNLRPETVFDNFKTFIFSTKKNNLPWLA